MIVGRREDPLDRDDRQAPEQKGVFGRMWQSVSGYWSGCTTTQKITYVSIGVLAAATLSLQIYNHYFNQDPCETAIDDALATIDGCEYSKALLDHFRSFKGFKGFTCSDEGYGTFPINTEGLPNEAVVHDMMAKILKFGTPEGYAQYKVEQDICSYADPDEFVQAMAEKVQPLIKKQYFIAKECIDDQAWPESYGVYSEYSDIDQSMIDRAEFRRMLQLSGLAEEYRSSWFSNCLAERLKNSVHDLY